MRAARNALGHRLDRILALRGAPLHRLAVRVDRGMYLGHEGMQVDAPLLGDGDMVEEHVHEHRLAAPDAAPDVEPLRRIAGLGADEPAERRGFPRRRIAVEFLSKSLEQRDDLRLRGVALESASPHAGLVLLADGHFR